MQKIPPISSALISPPLISNFLSPTVPGIYLRAKRAIAIVPILLSAIVITPTLAQPAPKAHSSKNPDGMLKMVMVDQAQLNPTQQDAFQQYLQTANLPPTKIGKRCQYYRRPQVWCLLLEPPVAEQIYQQLRRQPSFGAAAEIQSVRRIRGANRNPKI